MPPANNPPASLLRPAARIAAGTFVSRLLGLVRDLLIARLFGANQATDAFLVAFRIPNLMRRLFAEGTFAAALVPVLTPGGHLSGTATSERLLLREFAGSLTALLLAISALAMLIAPALVWLLAPGFALDAGQAELTTTLVRLTLPYLLLIGLTAFAAAVLNTHERFAVPAFTPALLNLALIGCALLLAPHLSEPVIALGWGVLLGGVAQLSVQLVALARLGLLAIPRINWHNPIWRAFLAALGPTLLGMSATQINLLLDTLLASFLAAGSISWLYYAERLMDFPLGILGIALGTAILPRLTRSHAAGQTRDFASTLDWALRWVVLLGLPATAGLLVTAEPLIGALFHGETFTAADVRATYPALLAYAIGLPFFVALKVLTPVFLSRGDARAPARISLIAITANLLFSLLLMGPFGHAGLALATSLAAALAVLLLLRAAPPRTEANPQLAWWPLFALLARALGASAIMAMSLVVLRALLLPSGLERTQGGGFLGLAGLMLCGVIIYVLALFALGLRIRHLRPA